MCKGGSRLIKLESTGKKLKEVVSKMKTKVNFNKSQTFKIYNLVTKSLIVIYIYIYIYIHTSSLRFWFFNKYAFLYELLTISQKY